MRFRAAGLFPLSLMLLQVSSLAYAKEDSGPEEYQIKAAFIFEFAKFVEWPPAALPKPSSPLIVGVLGENPFHDALEKTIKCKKVDEHPVIFMQFRTATDANNCHILFISRSEKARLPQILKQLNGRNVLTVSEMPGFTKAGGIINFVVNGTNQGFQINNDAANRAGLKISSKLLRMVLP
jgi:hypothetical protein